ncbi:hypothetical protein BZA77DRAFT_289320 [Pyronema omphalodes]|nr:hypothetical protein BZA77DRAFT_289320 [Pyronema omphalodes]
MYSNSSASLASDFSNYSHNSTASYHSNAGSSHSTPESTWAEGPVTFSNAPTLGEEPRPSSSTFSSSACSESKALKPNRSRGPVDLESGKSSLDHRSTPADTDTDEERVSTSLNKREWLNLPTPKGSLRRLWGWTEIPTWILGISTICGHPVEPACLRYIHRACLHSMLFAGIFLLSLVDIHSSNTRPIPIWGWCLTVSLYFSYMGLLYVDHTIWSSREAARKEAERWEVERLFVDGGRIARRSSRM